MSAPILRVRELRKLYPVAGRRGAAVHAVDGVSIDLYPGETLALVGESGSGKSTTGRCLLRLEEPTSGDVRYRDRDLAALAPAELRACRRHLQMVFQDPYDALNPRLTVGEQVVEPMRVHGLCSRQEAWERAAALFRRCGLQQEHLWRYPHELSGGQNQRAGIARALATDPELVVLDEPTSALDVSVQAQIVNLLAELQQERGLTYLFISHDLAVVHHLATRVAVMYLGQIVELGPRDRIFRQPLHPYTRALLHAVPGARRRPRERIVLYGEIPSAVNPPAGCRLYGRCPFAVPACAEQPQPLVEVERGHWVACHRVATGQI